MANVSFKCKVTEDQYDMDLPRTMLVSDAKKDLEAKVPALTNHDQKWIFQGRVLKDGDTLEQSGIKEDLCVHVMKTAKSAVAAASVPAASMSSASTPAAAPTFIAVPAFDQGMHMLLGNEEAKAKDAIILLLKIISNIIDKPMEEKYRKVKANSKAFTKLDVAGGRECVAAMGFNLVGEEYVLTPSAHAWEVLISCQAKLDRFMAKYIETQENQSQAVAAATAGDSDGHSVSKASTSDEQAAGGGKQVSAPHAAQSDEEAMAAAMQLMLSAMMNASGGDAREGGKEPANSSDSSSSGNCDGGDGAKKI